MIGSADPAAGKAAIGCREGARDLLVIAVVLTGLGGLAGRAWGAVRAVPLLARVLLLAGGAARGIVAQGWRGASAVRRTPAPLRRGPVRRPPVPISNERSASPQTCGTSASARRGEPVPFWIFSGAAIRIAPLGGSWSRLHRLARP